MQRLREQLLVSATTMDLLEALAAGTSSTPAGVVHFLASWALGDRAELAQLRRDAKRRPWPAARVVDGLRARVPAGKSVNHAAVQAEQSCLVTGE